MNKKITILFLFFYVLFSSQQNKKVVKEWTSYVQAIDVSDKSNWNFRLSAKMKKNKESAGNNGIWVRIDKKDKKMGFFENQYDKFKTTEDWKTYTISGKIDNDAQLLHFGAFAQDNGDYYFDDFKLEINDGKSKKWMSLPIKNSSFEDNIENEKNWFNGILSGSQTDVKNFKIDYSSETSFDGKNSLHIKGSNIIGSMPHGKFIEANGIKLYYETYGEGEPVLMIHGNGQSINAFMNQVDDFSKKYKVIIVDCRERGKSTFDKNVELTFDVQVEDLKQFLDKLGIKKVKILGWSDGGILAIMMSLKYPDLVEKFAASGANIFPEGLLDSELQDLKDGLEKFKKDNKDNKNDWLIDLYNLDYKYPQLKYEDLKNIKAKALIIAGDKDVIKIDHTVKIYESIPNSQLAIIPGASHMVPIEKPELFNSLVLKFFEN